MRFFFDVQLWFLWLDICTLKCDKTGHQTSPDKTTHNDRNANSALEEGVLPPPPFPCLYRNHKRLFVQEVLCGDRPVQHKKLWYFLYKKMFVHFVKHFTSGRNRCDVCPLLTRTVASSFEEVARNSVSNYKHWILNVYQFFGKEKCLLGLVEILS